MNRKCISILALLSFLAPLAGAQHIITTVAGGGPNNVTALQAGINWPADLFKDSAGNLYIAAQDGNAIYKIDTKGNFTTLAGNGNAGFVGDGGPATAAQLHFPDAVFVDSSFNIFIADSSNNVIRKIEAATGNIITVAGTGNPTPYTPDGSAATQTNLNTPTGVTVDGSGNIFIAEINGCRVREVVAATGNVVTVAGTPGAGTPGYYNTATPPTGNCGFDAANNQATTTRLNGPTAVVLDKSGNLFITDQTNACVRKISNGLITTVAGTCTVFGSGGNGGAPTSALFDRPVRVFVDGNENIFISDIAANLIWEVVASTNTILIVAGNGTGGYTGDGAGIPATQAELHWPSGVWVDSSGNLFLTDALNSRIREVTAANGFIQAIAGNGTPTGDGHPATSAQFNNPSGVAVDGSGNVFIADSGNNTIREVLAAAQGTIPAGDIVAVAGNGTAGYTGDNGPATSAELQQPTGVSVDSSGNILIADFDNNRIREVVAASGAIQTVAGNGTAGFSGDGGAATSAELNLPSGVSVDPSGNIFIADFQNNRIREIVAATGKIQTVAGNGTAGFSGDGGPATSAELNGPTRVFVDIFGNIFIADSSNNRVREIVATTGNIQTVAGNGIAGFSGDGGPATSAELSFPTEVFVDRSENIFIADYANNRVREVAAGTGTIQTVVGNGTPGFNGDNGPATSAELNTPRSLAGDLNANLFIADSGNSRIRKVTGLITGPPMNIAASGGTPQSTPVNTAFATPLSVTVTDSSANPVGGEIVTFTAPANGASGTFVGGSTTSTAATNAQGIATSPVFTANNIPGGPYNITAVVTGVQGSASFALTNQPALIITTSSLPFGQVGVVYSQTLVATGGTTPYTWSILSGTLPAGLTLNASTGAISGTPTTPQTSNFTVKVTDSENPAVSQSASLSILISGNLATLQVLPSPSTVGFSAPGVTSSVQFFAQDASGNAIPVTWSISPANGAGTITAGGLYTAPATPPSGSPSITVTVTATAVADPTKHNNPPVSFTLASNGLSACCTLPQLLTVAAGSTSTPTGVQLNGVPSSSNVPFTLSCTGLPVGAACAFTLPTKEGGTSIQSISGSSSKAFCYVLTTGPGGTTAAMGAPLLPPLTPSPNSRLQAILTFACGILALVLAISRTPAAAPRRKVALASIALVCVTVASLGACGGYSPANAPLPTGQVTPAGMYQIQILATPQPGSGFVQTQLIVPLTVTGN